MPPRAGQDPASGPAVEPSPPWRCLIHMARIGTALFSLVLLLVAAPGLAEDEVGWSNINEKGFELVVRKADRRMEVVSPPGPDGHIVRSYRIGLGFAPEGDKERQGDGKTPEGSFTITRLIIIIHIIIFIIITIIIIIIVNHHHPPHPQVSVLQGVSHQLPRPRGRCPGARSRHHRRCHQEEDRRRPHQGLHPAAVLRSRWTDRDPRHGRIVGLDPRLRRRRQRGDRRTVAPHQSGNEGPDSPLATGRSRRRGRRGAARTGSVR